MATGGYDGQVYTSVRARKPSRWLRKTKLCVYHLQNNCCLGSSCLFAHCLNELQDGPDLYKTQICADFKQGSCLNPDCTYAHGEEELQPFPTLKQKLCKWHRKGKCRNGENCSFAHGHQDLRTETGDKPFDDLGGTPPQPSYAAAPPAQQQCNPTYAAPPPVMQPSYTLPPPGSQAASQAALAQMAAMMQGYGNAPVNQVPYPVAPMQQQQPHGEEVMQYLSLQTSVPEPTPAPKQEVVYYWRRTPLNSKVAPFVPRLSPTEVAAMTCEEPHVEYGTEEASDDKSTSAETAGYLSD